MATFFTQNTDIFEDTDPGIVFSAADQTWTISLGVVVSSGGNDGVFGELALQSLFNNGSILSAWEFGAGVEMNGDNSFVSNEAGARIIGANSGVILDGEGARIDNKGNILGLSFIGVDFEDDSGNVVLNNSGNIFGRFDGVRVSSDAQGGTIRNSGVINSDDVAIDLTTALGLTTIIGNAAGAVIRGADSSIITDDCAFSLTNFGTLIGDIETDFDANVRDVVINHGRINGTVFLGAGNDLYNGTGGITTEFVEGEDGNDQLIGGAVADRLDGGDGADRLAAFAGNDRLDGGFGFDTLTGGIGSDRFVFDSVLGAALNVDRITDFAVNVDKIVIDSGVFTGVGPNGVLAAAKFHVGPAAADTSDRIIYNPNTGFLFHDADGKGGIGQVHFATLAPHLNLHNTDFLVIAQLMM